MTQLWTDGVTSAELRSDLNMDTGDYTIWMRKHILLPSVNGVIDIIGFHMQMCFSWQMISWTVQTSGYMMKLGAWPQMVFTFKYYSWFQWKVLVSRSQCKWLWYFRSKWHFLGTTEQHKFTYAVLTDYAFWKLFIKEKISIMWRILICMHSP